MKRKKLTLATAAIATSLMMNSAIAGQPSNSWVNAVENSGHASLFFDNVSSNNGIIFFPSETAAMAVPKVLRINANNYSVGKSGSSFYIRRIIANYEDNPMTLAEYLASYIDAMSNTRLNKLYDALGMSTVSFDTPSDGNNFIRQNRNIISDVTCIPHDGGCYLDVSHSENGSADEPVTLY